MAGATRPLIDLTGIQVGDFLQWDGSRAVGATVNLDWDSISGKPSTFPPDVHAASHAAAGSDPVSLSWSQVSKSGASLADLPTRAYSDLSGKPTLGALAALDTIADAQVVAGAAIAWSKISKFGASLADLPTRLFSDLQSKPTTLGGYGITDAVNVAQIGAASGVAPLDSGSKIPTSYLPALAITDTFVVASQAAMLALSAQTGDVAVRSDLNKSYILKGTDPTVLANWQELLTPTDTVLSVNGQTGAVSLTTSDIAEGSRLYYTDVRARGAISVGGPLTYNNGTGVLGVTLADATHDGYLSSGDWGTFNAKQAAFGNQTANAVYAGPISGGAAAPGFRALVAADIPALSYVPIAQVTGGGVLATGGFTLTVPATGTAALLGTANAFTAAQTVTLAPAANTVVDGLILSDTTPASAGNQQYSPALHYIAQGWKTTAAAASQQVEFRAYVKPVQGTTNPTGLWTLESSVNGGAWGNALTVSTTGQVVINPTVTPGLLIDSASTALAKHLSLRGPDGFGGFSTLDMGLSAAAGEAYIRTSANIDFFLGANGTNRWRVVNAGSFSPTTNGGASIGFDACRVNTVLAWAGDFANPDTGTTNVLNALTVSHDSTNAAAANFGVGVLFQGKDSTTTRQAMAQMASIWTTATHASPVSALTWSLVNGTAGTLAEYMRLTPTALTVPALKVGANQVVGAQGAAVADATGAGDVVAQLNTLLARLRTHGLIAP